MVMFPLKMVIFPLKMVIFPLKMVIFQLKIVIFPLKNGDVPIKNGDFPSSTFALATRIYRRNEQRHRIRMALARKIMVPARGIFSISGEPPET